MTECVRQLDPIRPIRPGCDNPDPDSPAIPTTATAEVPVRDAGKTPAERVFGPLEVVSPAHFRPSVRAMLWIVRSNGRITFDWAENNHVRSAARMASTLLSHYSPGEVTSAHLMQLTGTGDWDGIRGAFDENPWAKHEWFRANLLRWVEHVPHHTDDKPGMVSYYASPKHRLQGRVTITKPGRYLKRFFGDLLTPEQIEEHAVEWDNRFKPLPVVFTADPDEIAQVYEFGPTSCMKGGDQDFEGPCHPARVYGNSPDVALAYIGPPEGAYGRAVVWPEKKIWMRAYGDTKRLEAGLVALGYREGTHREWEDARLSRIEGPDGRFVMPYLDRCGYVRDGGNYLTMSRDSDDIGATNTNGLSDCSVPQHTCDMCGDRMDEEDAYYLEDEGEICPHCLHSEFSFCDGINEYVRDGEIADVAAASQRRGTFSTAYLMESDDWFLCDGYGDWYNVRDVGCVILDDGRAVSEDWAEQYAFRCAASDEWYETDGINRPVYLLDGDQINRGYFADNQEIAHWIVENDRDTDEDEIAQLVRAIRNGPELGEDGTDDDTLCLAAQEVEELAETNRLATAAFRKWVEETRPRARETAAA